MGVKAVDTKLENYYRRKILNQRGHWGGMEASAVHRSQDDLS